MTLPTADAVLDATQAIGLRLSVAEFHGSLVGWCAAGGQTEGKWLAKLFTDATLPSLQANSVLTQLVAATIVQLEDPQFTLELLLATDEAGIAERSQSLFEWCRAFLGGFGLAYSDTNRLSADGQEALHDLAQLARTDAADLEPSGDDDQSLEEISQFVRIAVLLLSHDCMLQRRSRQRFH